MDNEVDLTKSTITFVDEKDEAIARASDKLNLANKQAIDETYSEVYRPVKERVQELWNQGIKFFNFINS